MIDKIYEFDLDFLKETRIPNMKFVQGDSKASYISVNAKLNGVNADLTGVSPQIVFELRGLKSITGGASVMGSQIKIPIPANVLATPTSCNMLVSLVAGGGKKLTNSIKVPFKIISAETSGDPASDDHLPILTQIQGDLGSLQAQVDALVAFQGTETDPRLTQALADVENKQWSNYKQLQDAWQNRIIENEDMFKNTIECFNIKVNPGTFDFSAKNLIGRTWHFADGTTSTDERPTRVLSKAQTVRLTGSFMFSPNCEILDNNTNTSYVGDLSDLPNLSYYLDLDSCSNITGDLSDLPNLSYLLNLFNCNNITGDLSDLPNLSYFLSLYNCSNITGDLSDLPNLSYLLNLFNCNNITGDLSDLPNLSYYLSLDSCSNITGNLSDLPNLSYYLNLGNCSNITGNLSDLPNLSYYLNLGNCSNVTGVLNSTVLSTQIFLQGTGLSISDVDSTIANIVTANQSNGTLDLTGLQRSSASDANIATLQSRGWKITDATVI